MNTTFKQDVVQQLLYWLEDNIHMPLTIDDFVEKSGYSKWHLQRIFKDITGQKLASYCRQRRLTSSAFMLRLFDRQIESVSSEHGFSSYNSYHKTFKRHFNVTPAQYRDAVHWSCGKLCPPINLSNMDAPEGKLVELKGLQLSGYENHYTFTMGTIDDFCWQQREQFWQVRLAGLASLPETMYGLMNVIKDGSHVKDYGTLQYLTCLQHEITDSAQPRMQLEIAHQSYLHFRFCGDVGHYPNFIRLIYEHALPGLGAVRHSGHDIERFDRQWLTQQNSSQSCIDYYVPVVI